MHALSDRPINRSRKQDTQGFAALWLTFGLVALLGVSTLAVDSSLWYARRADAERTADAAALTGAYWFAHGANTATAFAKATAVANANGYTNVTITTPWAGQNSYFHVSVSRNEPTVFSGVFGKAFQTVSAGSTAQGVEPLHIDGGGNNYGQASGPVNYAAYGPDNGSTRGDAIDTKYRAIDGSLTNVTATDPNPYYKQSGIDYVIDVPSNYQTNYGNILDVEIFDPETSNGGKNTFDEIKGPSPSEKWRYTLYSDNGTPDDNSDDVQIATAVYGETTSDQQYDNLWVTPSGFQFDMSAIRAAHPNANFRLNVRSDDGSGNPGSGLDENGYLLRAGPPHPSLDVKGYTDRADPTNDATWYSTYGKPSGTSVAASSMVSINFNKSGTTDLLLGYVGPNPSGQPMTLIVHSFDMDTGGSAVWYTCDTYGSKQFTGIMSSNGTWSSNGSAEDATGTWATPSNSILLPAGYTGGTWTAHYTSGGSDNTTWWWEVDNGPLDKKGIIRLIATASNKPD